MLLRYHLGVSEQHNNVGSSFSKVLFILC